MHILYDADSRRNLINHLRNSVDTKFIAAVVAKKNSEANYYLAENPNLTAMDVEELSKDPDAYTRQNVAARNDLTPEILESFYKDKNELVRFNAIINSLTPYEVYKDIVINKKHSGISAYRFVWDSRCVEDVEVFHHFWETNKPNRDTLIGTLDRAIFNNLPVDPECAYIVHDEMRNGKPTISTREAYAESYHVALPEILDKLKEDPARPVINGVARNASAWVSTHEYLATSHKTPTIRIYIATVTKNNELLNKIYHGTKSKEIREHVEMNDHFVNLRP